MSIHGWKTGNEPGGMLNDQTGDQLLKLLQPGTKYNDAGQEYTDPIYRHVPY